MVFKKSVFFDCPLFLPKHVKNPLKFWSGKDQEKNIENRPKIDPKSSTNRCFFVKNRWKTPKMRQQSVFSKRLLFDWKNDRKKTLKRSRGDWTWPSGGTESAFWIWYLNASSSYALLFTAIYCYVLLFAAICCYLLLFAAMCCYSLLFAAMSCYLLPFAAVCCCMLLVAAICCYLLLLAAICC